MGLLQRKTMLLVEKEQELSTLLRPYQEVLLAEWLLESLSPDNLEQKKWQKPDLILYHLHSSQKGYEAYQRVNKIPGWSASPLFLFRESPDELDVVLCLELGVEDFFPIPFSPRVLLAKVKKLFSSVLSVSKELSFGEFTLELESQELKKNNLPIHTTFSEFTILKKLLSHRGKTLTRSQLLDDIPSKGEGDVIDRNIDVHVSSLRKKLGEATDWIQTVRGLGYRFRDAALEDKKNRKS